MDKATVSVPEAAKIFGISRNLAYELARTGELPTLRLGRRILIPRVALEELLRSSKKAAFSESNYGCGVYSY